MVIWLFTEYKGERMEANLSSDAKARRKQKVNILRIEQRLKTLSFPAVLATVISIIIVSIALLFEPVVGLADNGDFYRIITPVNLYKLDRNSDDEFMSYASTRFGVLEYYNESQEGSALLISSHTPFIVLARALDSIFTNDPLVFDIRFLGALMILLFAFAMYLIIDYVTHGIQRYAALFVALMGVFVLADTGYTAFFNSFFAEGLVYISYIIAIASALLMTQNRYNAYTMLIIFMISSIILTASKQQNAPTGVILGLMLAVLGFLIKDPKTQELASELKKRARTKMRAIFAVCGAALCVIGVASYLLIPQEYVTINAYHAMTRGIMMTSTDPEEALEHFDISEQYDLLNKSIYYEETPLIDPESPKLKAEFYSNYSFISICTYYITHFDAFLRMLELSMDNVWLVRPAMLGNFDRDAGFEPGAQTTFFTAYTDFARRSMPRTIGFVVIWGLVILGCCWKNKPKMLVLGAAMCVGLSQMIVSIIGAGDADISKHIFLFNVTFDMISFIAISAVIKSLFTHLHFSKAKQKRVKKSKSKQRGQEQAPSQAI